VPFYFISGTKPTNSNLIMSKKKLSDLSDLGGFIFSTDKNFQFENEEVQETLSPNKQFLEAVFSNKGRSGKTVTLIKGFVGNEDDLKELAKLLKTKCGVGGSVKDNEIIIQGNYRDKIMEILKKEGYNVKRVGG
jgi:translation initiation factor 1